jgi:hypothetical protein
VVVDELAITYESCHTVLEYKVQKLRIVTAPLFDNFKIHAEILWIDRVEPDPGFGGSWKNVDDFHLIVDFFLNIRKEIY